MKKNKIENFIFSKITYETLFKNINNPYQKKEAELYFKNAVADANFTLNKILPYLDKNIKILEIGGGLHLLSAYLEENDYDITSIEPGNFTFFIQELRENILNVLHPKKVITCNLEEFNTKLKYDFIFSINVLEHTDSVVDHLKLQQELLSDSKSKILIRCPNYNIPFEPHFYKFFIPYLPKLTFSRLLKKKLIKDLGEKKYLEILNSLNFNCKFTVLNKNFKIKTYNPFIEMFERIKSDKAFNERILKNLFLKLFYNFISKFTGNFFNLIPKRFYPYLIIELKK